MPSVEVQECPVFAIQWSRTHRQKFFRTIYCNYPEGEGQPYCDQLTHHYRSKFILFVDNLIHVYELLGIYGICICMVVMIADFISF